MKIAFGHHKFFKAKPVIPLKHIIFGRLLFCDGCQWDQSVICGGFLKSMDWTSFECVLGIFVVHTVFVSDGSYWDLTLRSELWWTQFCVGLSSWSFDFVKSQKNLGAAWTPRGVARRVKWKFRILKNGLSTTKFSVCVGCRWDPTQNFVAGVRCGLMVVPSLFSFCVGCHQDPTQNLNMLMGSDTKS